MTLASTLKTLERTLSCEPVPTGWTRRQPNLSAYDNIGTLIATMRNYHEADDSDSVIRSLLALPPGGQPDPRTLVEIAVTPQSINRLARRAVDADDTIAEITGVVCDPGPIDLDDCL